MSPAISLVINAYNAQPALDRQAEGWRTWPPALRATVEVVVVDDGSAVPLDLPPAALAPGLRVQGARVTEDIAWNMPGARNLGALLARAPWLLFHDVDHFVPVLGLARLAAHVQRLDAATLYRFARTEGGQPIAPHINSFLCARDAFWQAGGYDEDFAGHYGHEDACFHGAWQARVGGQALLTDVALDAQPRYSTAGLDRDTTRNSALLRDKAAAGWPAAARRLRFGWHTHVLPTSTFPDPVPVAASSDAAQPADLRPLEHP